MLFRDWMRRGARDWPTTTLTAGHLPLYLTENMLHSTRWGCSVLLVIGMFLANGINSRSMVMS